MRCRPDATVMCHLVENAGFTNIGPTETGALILHKVLEAWLITEQGYPRLFDLSPVNGALRQKSAIRRPTRRSKQPSVLYCAKAHFLTPQAGSIP